MRLFTLNTSKLTPLYIIKVLFCICRTFVGFPVSFVYASASSRNRRKVDRTVVAAAVERI